MNEYCAEKGFAGWFETSAKENIGIDEAASSLVSKVGGWAGQNVYRILCCKV